MKVVLLGASGYIGQHLLGVYPQAATPRIDIGDPLSVRAMLDEHRPDILLNAAGKTGRPNVDWCETHKEETLRANVQGPLNLREACAERGIYWMHMSSGCIYTGDGSTSLTTGNNGRGFAEDDLPNFAGSYYSRTKGWSEQMLKDFADIPPGILIVRPRMPFDGTDNPRNLIQKLKRYPKVLDEPNSLTYVPDMMAAIRSLLDRRACGIYNMVNPGIASPYGIMQRYKHIVDPHHACERLTIDTLGNVTLAGRSNCILSTEKLTAEGIAMRPVDDAITTALTQIASCCPVAV